MRTGDLGRTNAQRLLEVVESVPPGRILVDLGVVGAPDGSGTNGVSSEILLAGSRGKGSQVIGVECCGACPAHLRDDPDYKFQRMDSVTWLEKQWGRPFGLFFIDTLHNAEQVMCELYYLWPLLEVGGWAVFHDTAWPKEWHDEIPSGSGRKWDHVEAGLFRFFRDAESREVIYRVDYPEAPGMTFIQKKADEDLRAGLDWREPFMARRIFLGLQTWDWAVKNPDLPAGCWQNGVWVGPKGGSDNAV
jgi:hypothetical protein